MALRGLQRLQSFELVAMEQSEDTGEFLRLGGIDRANARVRVRAQKRRAVGKPRQIREVFDILRPAGDFFLEVEPRLAYPVLSALGFHDFFDPWACLIARQIFSGVSGTLCMRIPTASSTALHTAGATARMPPSPMPFAP